MISTCKRLASGNEVYARFHTSDKEVVRGQKHPEGTVECTFREPPTHGDKLHARAWVEKQMEVTGILVKKPHLVEKVRFLYVTQESGE